MTIRPFNCAFPSIGEYQLKLNWLIEFKIELILLRASAIINIVSALFNCGKSQKTPDDH